MTPQTTPRKRSNSSKVNLLISFLFHSAMIVALVFFAAREGLLGNQFRKIAVDIIKEKPVERPKEKEVEKPKAEPPKTEAPPNLARITRDEPPRPAPDPAGRGGSSAAPPVTIAPPAADVGSFDFGGGKALQSSSDPAEIYRGFIEYSLRSKWTRPPGIVDDYFVAEVEMSVDRSGHLSRPEWKKGSGDSRWDDSVRQAIAATPALGSSAAAEFSRARPRAL